MRRFVLVLSIATVFPIASLAHAQPLPEGLQKGTTATSGKTEVAKEGFQQQAEPDKEENDASTAEVSAGGLVATGNSRQIALTSSAKARVRRMAHQGSFAAAANYAMGASEENPDLQRTVANVQGLLRYDFFFAEVWSAFLSASARRDEFQGLDLRLNVDPGVAYHLIHEPQHLLWFELGYDLQYDIRRDENLALSAEPLDKTETRHSARGFTGYSNKLNERVTVETGLEYLQSVTTGEQWRLNWDLSMTSNIAGRFSTAAALNLRYDNAPLPGVEEVDVLTSFNLVYALL